MGIWTKRIFTFAIVLLMQLPSVSYGGKIFFAPAAKLLYGQLSSPNAAISARSMAFLQAETLLGTSLLNPLLLGLRGHYTWTMQLTSPQSVENSNLQGMSSGAGAVGGFQFGKWQLLGFYDFYSRYSPSFPTDSGETIEFTHPSSFGGTIRYRNERTFYGLEYFQTTYKQLEFEASSSPDDLTFGGDAQLKLWGIGISVGAFFN